MLGPASFGTVVRKYTVAGREENAHLMAVRKEKEGQSLPISWGHCLSRDSPFFNWDPPLSVRWALNSATGQFFSQWTMGLTHPNPSTYRSTPEDGRLQTAEFLFLYNLLVKQLDSTFSMDRDRVGFAF